MRGPAVAVASLCVACASASSPQTAPPLPGVIVVNGGDVPLRELATRIVYASTCRRLERYYLPLRDEENSVTGRWRVDTCARQMTAPFAVAFALGGRGWKYVDASKSGTRVRGYVGFQADVTANYAVHVGVTDSRRLALALEALAVRPDRFAALAVPRATGFTSAFASDEDVRSVVEARGAEQMTGEVARGVEVSWDPCTGQTYAGPPGEAAYGAAQDGLRHLEAGVLRLRNGGLDAAGPFPGRTPLRFDVYERGQVPAWHAVVCAEQAHAIVDAWIAGRLPPLSIGITVAPGAWLSLPSPPGCSSLVMLSLAGDETRVLYRVTDGAPVEAFADCR